MKNWSKTKKVFAVLGVLAFLALIVYSIKEYRNSARIKSDLSNMRAKVDQVVEQAQSDESITGKDLVKSIRDSLSKHQVSEVGVKFYQS